MKQLFSLLLFCCITHFALAQEDTPSDSEEQAKEVIVKRKTETTRADTPPKGVDFSQMQTRDRLIFEIAHDNWTNKPDSLKVRWWNRGVNIYLMYDMPLLNSKNVSFAPGLGISTTNVYHNSRIMNNDSVSFFRPIENISDTLSWRKNKLSTTFIDVPLELRFRTNPNRYNKSFKIAIGARVGYMLSSKIKYKGELENEPDEVFLKNKRLPNINNFKYGPSIRIGYSNFNIFAYYSISTLFERNAGPGIRPLSIGFSFNSF